MGGGGRVGEGKGKGGSNDFHGSFFRGKFLAFAHVTLILFASLPPHSNAVCLFFAYSNSLPCRQDGSIFSHQIYRIIFHPSLSCLKFTARHWVGLLT